MSFKYRNADEEFEMEYKGVIYTIGVSFETVDIDDSYNGDRYGDFYVFKSSHKEIQRNSIEVQYIDSDLDYAIKPCDIDDKFYKEIVAEVMAKDWEL